MIPDVTITEDLRQLFYAHDKRFARKHYVQPSFSKRVRSMEQWAEEEVILPTGPFEGLKFKTRRQPFAKFLFDAYQDDYWMEYAITGASQMGKSLLGFAFPVCWTLTERKQDAIISAPTMEILEDKVKRDIYPVLEASRYRDIIPRKGGGSKGGIPDRIDFENGTVLKLMSFEGGDKSKASFTCPNLFFTEIDGSKSQTTSLEANPIEQIKARSRASEREKRFIVLECTASVEEGRIWQLTQHIGSAGKIMLKCPHCGEWSCPERENLKGWNEAKTEIEAEQKTAWYCSHCDQSWTERERKKANGVGEALLMHKGQSIKNDKIVGDLPETRTFGFRFSAVNNMFLPASDIGVDCWNAMQDEDDLDQEKKLTQFVFALPYEPPGLDMVKMDREAVEQRQLRYPKGSPPKSTQWITLGCDVGKFDCWWVAIAWLLPTRVGLIMDYGRIKLRMERNGKWGNANDYGFDTLFNYCMDEWKKGIDGGWPNSEGEVYDFDQLWIDSRYQGDDPDADVVYQTIKRWGDKRVLPVMGHATNQYKTAKYRPAKLNAKNIVSLGHEYDIRFIEEGINLHRAHINSDAWKTIVQRSILREPETEGALMLYNSVNPREHAEFVKHIDSEVRERFFDPEKGHTEQWVAKREANHWLDGLVYACAAGHRVGYRTSSHNERKKRQPRTRTSAITGRNGRSFVAKRKKR